MDDKDLVKEVMVSVICLTYNHESYIRQCLDGFVMQKTDFAFEAIVHDDASTDHTAEIIREYEEKYPNIIKPIYQDENQFSKNSPFLETYVLPKLKGKYIALCEGDDYWTDPLKLQKQVEILDSNPNCTLCYHACKNIYEDGFVGLSRDFGTDVKNSYSFKDIVYKYSFQTATVMFRKELIFTDLLRGLFSVGFSFGDNLLYMAAAHYGDVIGLTEEMSVYRRVNNGLSVAIHKGETIVKDTRAYINTLKLFGRDEKKCIYLGKIRPNMFKILMDDSISFVTYISLVCSLFMKMPYYGLYIAASHLKFKVFSVFRKE